MSALASDTRKPRRVLVAIHGILTGHTNPGWIDRLAHYLWLRGDSPHILKRKYLAGPFPMWNVWIKNPWLARSLANELRAYCEDGAELCFVTHSNGADIAVKAIRLLGRWGFRTKAAVFIAGAISCDVRRSGIRDLLACDHLGRTYAYSAPDDLVLRLRAVWPNGHLGRLGFRKAGSVWPQLLREQVKADLGKDDDLPLVDRAFTRWFTGGHSGYFTAEREAETFNLIAQDLFSKVAAAVLALGLLLAQGGCAGGALDRGFRERVESVSASAERGSSGGLSGNLTIHLRAPRGLAK